MLSAIIKISSIDYENTLQHIFPVVSEKVQKINSKSMVIRLFQELGGDALPVLIGVTSRLPENTKNELLIRGLNAYSPKLKDKLNEELQKDKLGCCIKIGAISVEQRDSITLDIGQIDINYHALLKNEHISKAISDKAGDSWIGKTVKTVAGVASTIIPNTTVERKGLDLLQQNGNQNRLLKLIKREIGKYGVKVDIDEIQISQVEKIDGDIIEITKQFALSEETENDIISALAGYLRDNVSNRLAEAR